MAFLLQIDEQSAQKNYFFTESGAFLQVSLFTDPATWNPGSKVIIQTHTINDPNLHATKGTIKPPNFSAFFEMLMRIQHVYEGRPGATVDLVLDSSTQFDRLFGELLETVKQGELRKLVVEGRIRFAFGSGLFNSFEAKDSAGNQFLQIADFLASGIRYTHGLCLEDYSHTCANEGIVFIIGVFLYMLEAGMVNSVTLID